jgi:low affinity Fe/Cu permease
MRLSEWVARIPGLLWLAGGNLAEQISQLVDTAAQHHKLDELIVRLAARYPSLGVDTGKE